MIDFEEKIGLKCLSGENNRAFSGCYIGDVLSFALTKLKKGDIWITSQTNINVIAIAYWKEASCVIVPDGILMEDDVISAAEDKNVCVYSSKLSAYELAVKINTVLNGGKYE